jgi:hypothetical protein
LPFRSPFTTAGRSAEQRIRGREEAATGMGQRWKQLFRPCMLGIAGLAIALFAWGLGYKMSLYHRHEDSARQLPAAKLWIKPRWAATTAVRVKVKAHFIPDFHACVIPLQSSLRILGAAADSAGAGALSTRGADMLSPSRAPPFHRLYLA